MSRAEHKREYRAKQKAPAVARPPGPRVVIGDPSGAFYLARIAELEDEVRTLKAELVRRDTVSAAGVTAPLARTPSMVIADGTRGMRRGVSGGQTRGARGADTGTGE